MNQGHKPVDKTKKSGFSLESFKVSDDVKSAADAAMKKSFRLAVDPHGLDKLTRTDLTLKEAIALQSDFEKQNTLLGLTLGHASLQSELGKIQGNALFNDELEKLSGRTFASDELRLSLSQSLGDIGDAEKLKTSLLGIGDKTHFNSLRDVPDMSHLSSLRSIADKSHFDLLFGANTFESKFSQYEIRREQELRKLFTDAYPETIAQYVQKQAQDQFSDYTHLLKPIQEQAELQAEFLGLALYEAVELGDDAEIQSILENPSFGIETIKAMYRAASISNDERQKIKDGTEEINRAVHVKNTEMVEKVKAGYKKRADFIDKQKFQKWVTEKNIQVANIGLIEKHSDFPLNINYELKTLKKWYKEVMPNTLKGGRPKRQY